MNTPLESSLPKFEIRFASLYRPGRGYAFPCDQQGHVDLDALSERSRTNYLYARAMIGRENSMPCIFVQDVAEATTHH